MDIAFNLIITCCRKAADNAEEVEEVEDEEGELWLQKEGTYKKSGLWLFVFQEYQ